MAYKCDMCSKGIEVGRSHTHHPGVAGGRWKKRAQKTRKVFKPNLHWARVVVHGVRKRMRLCTKCLRRLKSQNAKVKSTMQNEKILERASFASG